MTLRGRSIRVVFIGTLFLAATAAVRAGDDHELAGKALLEGHIRTLSEIEAAVNSKLPGESLGVELEVEDGRALPEHEQAQFFARMWLSSWHRASFAMYG